MIKKGLILLLLFQLQFVLAQKTLEQVIDEVPFSGNHYSPYSYSDGAGKIQGFSINDEQAVLNRLKLEPLEHAEYYITGKYEINGLLLLFFSKYWDTEDVHFAILLDKSLHINTPSGIRVRTEATTNSEVVTSAPNAAVFDYLSRGNYIDSTSVYDNGKYLKDYWLQIADKDSLHQLGYIFGAFAKRRKELVIDDYKVVLEEISKEEFYKAERERVPKPSIEKVTDIKKIKTILKDQFIIKYDDESYPRVEKVVGDNGKEIDMYFDECDVIAYYPEYRYLLFECGHSSESIIDLKNGNDDIDNIGNPDYYLPSQKNTFSLKGYYTGQSFVHFLEKNITNSPSELLFSLSDFVELDYIENYFWKDDHTLFLLIHEEYYKVEID